MEKRPTLQELASGDDDCHRGIVCPKCGCKHLKAENTKRYGEKMYRYRRCRHCGTRVRTREEVIGSVNQKTVDDAVDGLRLI